MQPRFPKTRTHFLYYNIARSEESFAVLLFYYIYKTNKLSVTEADLEGGTGGAHPPFCNHLLFCDHFEELQTVLI